MAEGANDTPREQAPSRLFWDSDYRHPVELGFFGVLEELGTRAKEVALWTVGLTLVPIGVVILAILGIVFFALVQAGLITDSPQQEQPADASNSLVSTLHFVTADDGDTRSELRTAPSTEARDRHVSDRRVQGSSEVHEGPTGSRH